MLFWSRCASASYRASSLSHRSASGSNLVACARASGSHPGHRSSASPLAHPLPRGGHRDVCQIHGLQSLRLLVLQWKCKTTSRSPFRFCPDWRPVLARRCRDRRESANGPRVAAPQDVVRVVQEEKAVAVAVGARLLVRQFAFSLHLPYVLVDLLGGLHVHFRYR